MPNTPVPLAIRLKQRGVTIERDRWLMSPTGKGCRGPCRDAMESRERERYHHVIITTTHIDGIF